MISYYRQKPVRTFDLNKTLYSTVLEVNQENKGSDAVGFLGTNITFQQMFSNVDRLADAYYQFGVREGDTVAICTINMPIVQENLLALSKLGVTSKWIDLRIKETDLITKINESNVKIVVVFEGILEMVQKILKETDVEKVIVASPKDYLHPIVRVFANIKDKKEGTSITLPNDKTYIKYTDFLKKGSPTSKLQPVSFEKDRPSLIIQSSGSTGKSKSIIHTEYNFNSEMQKEAYSDLPLAPGKTMYNAIPPFIIYGLCNSTYASLAFSMKSEMTPFVTETTVYDDLGKYDFACAAPLHYRYLYQKIEDLVQQIEECRKDSSALAEKRLSKALRELSALTKKIARVRAFVSGGDKISAEELLTMQHVFGTNIINGYGNNELVGAAIISPVYASKPDSIGIPLKGIEVKTFDPELGTALEDGQEGELCVHSDSVFVGYLNNEEETKKIKRVHEDGKEWIHTGDLGYVDQDGFVYVTGRSKRLIKRAAFKIAPETIEEVIINLSSVRDCVVVKAPDEEELEVPCAFVELSDDTVSEEVIKEEILKLCYQKLPDYEVPKYVFVLEKIPYKNGKHAFKELEQTAIEKTVKQKQKILKN